MKIVLTGGVARPNSYELVGPLVTSALQNLALDCTILGVDAVHPHFGAATHDDSEASANANRSLAERGGTVIVVADSSKLGRRAFARVCALDAVSTLVTDKDAPQSFVDEITVRLPSRQQEGVGVGEGALPPGQPGRQGWLRPLGAHAAGLFTRIRVCWPLATSFRAPSAWTP
ncbi:hypothetical protein ACFY2M_39505 [Streptomyces sp. NPDC001276]|uniref:hypothetical protein n=1 Tax=Streptomyces sp. NPDC001276 TaxID=3364555 RepID=UPI0036C44A0B